MVVRNVLIFALLTLNAEGVCADNSSDPVLRIGAMTDSHLMPNDASSHRRARACLELFRRNNVDVVVNTGDIAAQSQVSELELFRKMFDEIFSGTECVPIFGIANHDYNYVPNTWRQNPRRNDPKNIEAAWRALGMRGPNPTAVIKGYRFVNVFSDERPGVFAEMVEKAVSENEAGKPVFVVNHVPPARTTTATERESSQAIRNVLNKYPQVVALTGHTHTSISWPANIWQGEFTAVNLGANATDSNKIDGEAMVMDVFSDRIDIRRYEAVSGREIGANDRWSIPLPLDPAHGPYRIEHRKMISPTAGFPADASALVRRDEREDVGVFRFTSALPHNVTYRYNLIFESQQAGDGWTVFSAFDWEVPQVFEEPEMQEISIPIVLFGSGRPCRATIKSVNSYGIEGKGHTFSFVAPRWTMQELSPELTRIVRYQNSSKMNDGGFELDEGGWFERRGKLVAAVLPKDFSTAVTGKKSVSLLFDVASDNTKGYNTVAVARLSDGGVSFSTVGGAVAVIGDYQACQYAWTIRPQQFAPEGEYCLVFRGNGSGRFKVRGIHCFIR